MPQVVTFSNGNTITYLYAADGRKLRTVHVVNGTTTTTDYSGNVIYESGIQKLLLTEADNPKSKYYNKSTAHIIDSYELTDNNCTTFVSDAVNKLGSKALNINRIQQHSTLGTFTSYTEQERFVIPASLKKHLDNISVKNNVVYKTK